MAKYLRLTGLASFSSPYTYRVGIINQQIVKVTDADGAILLAMNTKHPITGAPLAIFTEVAGTPVAQYDLTDDVNSWTNLDGSVTILPELLASRSPYIPRGIMLRGRDALVYGFSDGLGGYEFLDTYSNKRKMSDLIANAASQLFVTAGADIPLARPVGATMLTLIMCSSGAGGASGRRGAAGSIRCGGGGGAGGTITSINIPVEDLIGGALTLDIGAAPAGGAAVAVNDTNGNPGIAGNVTQIKKGGVVLACIGGGNPGLGGTNAQGLGGSANVGSLSHAAGTTGQAANPAANAGSYFPSGPIAPGHAGGSISAADVVYAPGYQGAQNGVTAVPSAVASANGVGQRVGAMYLSTGGNGGIASIVAAAGAGGNGIFGSGGGGGGASLNGNNSGAGGSGGAGWAIAIWR